MATIPLILQGTVAAFHRRMKTRGVAAVLLMITAACGNGARPVTVRGDFADSSGVPERVLAVEASREAEVSRGAFELRGLSPGPATLRLVRGTDSTLTLAIESLAAGSVLELHGLKADAASGRVFPRSVALEGAPQVTLNGVRLAPESTLPAEIDTPGVVLALAPERDALL